MAIFYNNKNNNKRVFVSFALASALLLQVGFGFSFTRLASINVDPIVRTGNVDTVVQSCKQGDLTNRFYPWKAEQLSAEVCSGKVSATKSVEGYCVSNEECSANDGVVETIMPMGTSKLCSSDKQVCCVPKQTCSAKSVVGMSQQQSGTCLLPSYCVAGVADHRPINNATYIDCKAGMTCCNREASAPTSVLCPNRYTVVDFRFDQVLSKLQNMGAFNSMTDFERQRLHNFLPYTFETFEYLRGDVYCAELGDCASATYWAFIYHMLRDVTTLDPNQLFMKMEFDSKLSSNLYRTISTDIQNNYNGQITPEAFGYIVRELWEDRSLNLVQYNTGSCSDWIRLSHAVLGESAGWECGLEWEMFIMGMYCRPTKQSNLGDCAGGQGVCYQHANGAEACAENGIAELPSDSASCAYRYGTGAVCCAKKQLHSDNMVEIINNEYHNIPVVINHNIDEDPSIITNLESAFTAASQQLFVASGYRAFFKT